MPPLTPDLADLLLIAIANPAAIAAGYMIGRHADQRQKIVLAGFVSGVAGVAFAWALMATGFAEPKVRLLGGVFVVAGIVGIGFAALGFATRRWLERR